MCNTTVIIQIAISLPKTVYYTFTVIITQLFFLFVLKITMALLSYSKSVVN